MTLPELLALKDSVEARKAEGRKPTLREVATEALGVVTLGECLRAEDNRDGHVEFRGGRPRWVKGPARFRP
ncbi:MAG TPA: hypothetical protein VLT58_19130 [Polyangia bacterium]|nr:hypothetical protein [Polyangia bacterium]